MVFTILLALVFVSGIGLLLWFTWRFAKGTAWRVGYALAGTLALIGLATVLLVVNVAFSKAFALKFSTYAITKALGISNRMLKDSTTTDWATLNATEYLAVGVTEYPSNGARELAPGNSAAKSAIIYRPGTVATGMWNGGKLETQPGSLERVSLWWLLTKMW